MDLSILFISLITLIVLNIFWRLKRWHEFVKKYEKFPGPKPIWPFLGNVTLLLSKKGRFTKRVNGVLDEMYLKYKEEGMFLLFIGPKASLYIHEPSILNELLKDNTFINKTSDYAFIAQWLKNGLVTANGQMWRAKRKLMNPTFHTDILNKFIPLMNEEICVMMKIIDSNINSDYIDIHQLVCNLTTDIIVATAMGLPLGLQLDENIKYAVCLHRILIKLFDRIYNPLIWSDSIYYKTNSGKQFKEDVAFLDDFTMKVIEARKERLMEEGNNEDGQKRKLALLDLLLSVQMKDNSIKDENILEDISTLIAGGNEPSSAALAWAFLLIGHYQDVQNKMREELDSIFGYDRERGITREDLSKMIYIECVVKEVLRIYPPAPMIARLATSDMQIGGLKIPKGTSIWLNFLKLHQNEDTFPNPLEFKPERFLSGDTSKINASFMPFAAGSRNCIGHRFAMIEMKLVLAHIFRKYSVVSIDDEHMVEKVFDLSYRPKGEIRIKIFPISNKL